MDMVLDMDTLVLDTMVLDTEFMESALLMPSQKLTPTFCMEDIDTLDMPDTMDTPMVDMPTMDKLFPLNRQPTILVFFISDHIFSA